jgi:hypothetical protein
MDNIIGLKEILIMINKLYYFGIFYYIFSVVIMILLVVGIFFVIYVLTFGIICYSPFFQSILGTYYKSIVVFFINMFVFGLIPSITTIYYLFWFPISKSNLAEELPQLLFIKNVKKDGFKIFLAILLGISYICITLLNYWISIVFLGPIFLVLLSQRSFYSNIYQSLFHFSSQSQPPQLQPQQIATNQYSQ